MAAKVCTVKTLCFYEYVIKFVCHLENFRFANWISALPSHFLWLSNEHLIVEELNFSTWNPFGSGFNTSISKPAALERNKKKKAQLALCTWDALGPAMRYIYGARHCPPVFRAPLTARKAVASIKSRGTRWPFGVWLSVALHSLHRFSLPGNYRQIIARHWMLNWRWSNHPSEVQGPSAVRISHVNSLAVAVQFSFIAFPCNLWHIVWLLAAQIKYDSDNGAAAPVVDCNILMTV